MRPQEVRWILASNIASRASPSVVGDDKLRLDPVVQQGLDHELVAVHTP
jgi:hypothetical protein